jgi:chromosome segregation ATPase
MRTWEASIFSLRQRKDALREKIALLKKRLRAEEKNESGYLASENKLHDLEKRLSALVQTLKENTKYPWRQQGPEYEALLKRGRRLDAQILRAREKYEVAKQNKAAQQQRLERLQEQLSSLVTRLTNLEP